MGAEKLRRSSRADSQAKEGCSRAAFASSESPMWLAMAESGDEMVCRPYHGSTCTHGEMASFRRCQVPSSFDPCRCVEMM